MKLFSCALPSVLSYLVKAQTNNSYTSDIYFTWGYNTEWFSKSTIQIAQPSLGNSYQLQNMLGHDRIELFNNFLKQKIYRPQYNYRFGFFLKKKPSWGFELIFDHIEYTLTTGQKAHWAGIVNNRQLDTTIIIQDRYFSWYLNNGANFFCFNVIKRFFITETKQGKLKLL